MIEHKVTMKSEDPIHIRQFRIPLEHRQTIYDWVDELLKKGAIEVSHSCFNSPIFLVPKPHGHGMRAVLDFREVNATSVPDRYTIREVRDCVDEIGLARVVFLLRHTPSFLVPARTCMLSAFLLSILRSIK